jgi:hypothetical protein
MHTRPLKIAEKERRCILPAHLALFYSLGSGVGAIASTGIYTLAGWAGAARLGAAGVLFWLAIQRIDPCA